MTWRTSTLLAASAEGRGIPFAILQTSATQAPSLDALISYQQLRDPNRITQLLQTNQEIQITWVPGMWEDPQPVTFADAANVVTGRLITLTNRIGWAVQVRINGENLAIPANRTVRYTAQGSKWYLVPAR